MKIPEDNLAETDNFIVWRSKDDEETFYHIELGGITLHLMSDEWDELVTLIKGASTS